MLKSPGENNFWGSDHVASCFELFMVKESIPLESSWEQKVGGWSSRPCGRHFISGDIWVFRETTGHGAWPTSAKGRTPPRSWAWSSGRLKWGCFSLRMMVALPSGPAPSQAKKREAWGGELRTVGNRRESRAILVWKRTWSKELRFCFQFIHDAIYAFSI